MCYLQRTDLLCKYLLLCTSLDNSSGKRTMEIALAPYKLWLLLGFGVCHIIGERFIRVSASLIGWTHFPRYSPHNMALSRLV